jgi:hypothetical protein
MIASLIRYDAVRQGEVDLIASDDP